MSTRFTPTCVGTSMLPLILPKRASVHPHVRGDIGDMGVNGIGGGGSPPRAWGHP